MIIIARVKFIHLLIIFMLALGAFSVLFWPSRSSRINYWQDRLFSPGTVSLAHKTNANGRMIVCSDCHQPGKAMANTVCWNCHNRKYFENNRPFLAESHQLFNKKDYCRRCHIEHNGDYMALGFAGFAEQAHRQLPVKTDNCLLCHRLAGSKAHPTVINKDCRSCHNEDDWSSQFDHRQYLTKASTATAGNILGLCRKCHQRGYHYTEEKNARQSCIFCHENWGKRKNKPVPYPEGIFARGTAELKER